MVTASFFVLAFSGCICQALLNPPILLVEEEPNAPLLPGSLSTCQVQSMPPPQNCTYVYVRLRLGGWSREFMIGRDAMMCEFIHHDKRRNRFYIRGPMFKKMYRTPTYVMPDQKSLLIQMVMRRSDPITVPPPSVRLRLENAEPAAGLFVYSVEMFIPNLRMTVTYPVYTALYGGTNERIDALFKQTSIVQGSPTSPPTYGLTYFDIGFFCYMYSTLCFFMTSFFPVLKATVEMRTSDLFKQAIMVCARCACPLNFNSID